MRQEQVAVPAEELEVVLRSPAVDGWPYVWVAEDTVTRIPLLARACSARGEAIRIRRLEMLQENQV
jgi:hypothetical protein